MKKHDKGMDELLALLRAHPELMKELVFDPTRIQHLLRSKAARRLTLGVNTKAFLKYVAGPRDGYPVMQCFDGTRFGCAKGTKFALCGGGTRIHCGGGTRTNCGGGTKPR